MSQRDTNKLAFKGSTQIQGIVSQRDTHTNYIAIIWFTPRQEIATVIEGRAYNIATIGFTPK